MTARVSGSPFCSCGAPLLKYDGAQHFPAGDTLHLWQCPTCKSSLTFVDPSLVMAALVTAAELLAGNAEFLTLRNPPKHLALLSELMDYFVAGGGRQSVMAGTLAAGAPTVTHLPSDLVR